MAMLSVMKLTAKDGDELVPERLGRLAPKEYAAAQAVASAARELGENEAASPWAYDHSRRNKEMTQ
jgi:hypothetical protein